jgi:sugar phosphate isomerase/epimerase
MKLGIAVAPKEALPSAFVVFRDEIEINIKKAHALGFDGVELALLDSSQIDVDEVLNLCQKYQLDVPMVSSGQVYAQGGLCFSSSNDSVRSQAVARIKGLIDIAEKFGSMVNIGRVRGPIETEEPYENSENRFLDSLDEVARYAAPKDVLVAVEPVNRYELNFINNVSEAYEVITKRDIPNVKIMPDTFHMNIEDQSIEATFIRYRDHIAYIHFADSNRRAPGQGHLNFPNIINTLKATGYDGYVTAEILPLPSPDEAAQQAVKHLKPLVQG